MRRPIRSTVVAATIAAAVGLAVSAAPAIAGPRPRVGPHQVFDGLVNGKRGTDGRATIMVACAGPVMPGQTGQPVAGQTVEILPAVSVSSHSGETGDSATEIEVFFGAPPPATHAASTAHPAAKATVTFHRYALNRAIPAALELPCSGTSQVTFVPFPRSQSTWRPATVLVRYVRQP